MDAFASLEKTTHATRDDVEAVASSFRAPDPISAKRRRPSGRADRPGQPAPRPA